MNQTGFKALVVKAFIAVSLTAAISGCHYLIRKVPTPMTIDGFSSPESVVSGRDCRRFYISNMGAKLEPSARDNDGFISLLSYDGTIKEMKFLPKEGYLNSPKGMALLGDTLYVADVDRIVGFDTDSREQVFELDFSAEKTAFLNDLAVMDEKTLFVSATDIGKVYRVTLGNSPAFSVVADGIAGPNGLYYDGDANKLYVVGFGSEGPNGELGVITLDGAGSYQRLAGPIGYLDGVAMLPGKRLLFSDWVSFDKPGVLRTYDLKTGEMAEVRLGSEVRGPADFYIDRKAGTIWMPKMMEGKVLVDELK